MLRNLPLLLIVLLILSTIHIYYTDRSSDTTAIINTDTQKASTKIRKAANYEWVFAVYLDGDNNLEEAAIDDFLEMSSVGSTSSVAIVVLFDRCEKWNSSEGYSSDYGNWTDARIFKIDVGETPNDTNADEVWGEVNMGDPSTLSRFIRYVVENYSAERYALIIWDHGGGYYGACWDEDNGYDSLSIAEIRQALANAYNQTGRRIDILGFDACLMGDIEVAYALRDYVDIVVFSQEYEPGDGWPYDDILESLTANPTMSPISLASTIVDKYVQFYSNQPPPNYDENVTLSAVNVTYIAKHTFAAINRVAGYLLRYYDNFSSDILFAVNNAESFYYEWQKDLKHFFILLKNKVSDTCLIGLLNDAIDKIDGAIIANGSLSGHPNAYGLSIYLNKSYSLGFKYDNLDSSLHHQWDELEKRISGRDPGIWFYDIIFYGLDLDGDGSYGSSLKIGVDLDSQRSQDVYVKIYGYNGTAEELVGQSPTFTINNATSSDSQNISITISSNATYSFRIEIWNSTGFVKEFFYYCDANITDLRLETIEPAEDTAPPTIKILSPENNSIVYDLNITLEVLIDDNIGVSRVEVYLNGSSVANYTVIPTEIPITLPTYGVYNITIVAVDKYSNTAKKTIFIETKDVEPPVVEILSPANNSVIYELSVTLELYITDNVGISHVEIYLNGDLVENYSYAPTTVTLNLPSYGLFIITVVAVDVYSNPTNKSLIIEARDIEPPTITVISPTNGSTIYNLSATIEVNISDNSEIAYVEVYVNGSLVANYTYAPTEINLNFDTEGVYVVTIVAVDLYGNEKSLSLILRVSPARKTPSMTVANYLGIFVLSLLLMISLAIVYARSRQK